MFALQVDQGALVRGLELSCRDSDAEMLKGLRKKRVYIAGACDAHVHKCRREHGRMIWSNPLEVAVNEGNTHPKGKWHR